MFDDITNEILENLEKTQKEFWNIDRETATFLYMMIKTQNTKNALELGTSNGYSGIWLSKALKETNGHLTTIEFWEKRQVIARENFKKCQVDDIITPLIGSATSVLSDLKEQNKKFDFVFIDANKKEYIEYFKIIKPMLLKNALIFADNVISHKEKVMPYIDLITNDKDFDSVLLNFEAGLYMSRLK